MKVYSLSDPKERMGGICFSAVMCVVMVALVIALRSDILIMLMTLLAAALLIFFLVLYMVNVTKSACVYHPDTRIMEVKGLRSYEVDLSQATTLQTISMKAGHAAFRTLVFTDDEENIIARVPTMFTSRQGILAEPFAKAMAEDMGLKFQANVPIWEYDEEARKEHEKEVALQEKLERKERSKARGKWLIQKYRKRMK